ncbi:MAG: 30S ribosomal protein S21 [bacterium]|nr:30S ribosomal protein S21 [bacterium]
MSINVEVSKSGNESTLSTIRKFSRRVQGTGLVRTVRGQRYFVRSASKIVKKKRALKMIKRRAEYKQLIKEGKVIEAPTRHGHGGRPSYRSPQTEQSSTPRPAETTTPPVVR